MTVSNCLFCDCALCEVDPPPNPDKNKISLLLRTFFKYCCRDFNIMTQFNYENTPQRLPFCPKCESEVTNLSELHCQLERVQLAISTTVNNLSREIIESTHSFFNNGNIINNYGEEEEEEDGQGLLHFDMTNPKIIRRYRRAMYKNLSPKVILSPVNVTFQPSVNNNDNCNDLSITNYSHQEVHEGEEQEEEEEEGEEIPIKRFKTSPTTKNNNRQDNNQVKIEADENLRKFLQEWPQQQNPADDKSVINTDEPLNNINEEEESGSFDVEESLNSNCEDEEGEEQQQCMYDNCSMVFSSRIGLIRHEKIHEKEIHDGPTPFKCNYADCPLSFASKSEFQKHVEVHKL